MADGLLLNTESALDMVDGDTSLFKMLLEAFLNDTPFDPAHLTELLEKNDTESAAKYVHRVKGAAAQLGAEQLASAGALLEKVLRGKESGDTTTLAKEFTGIYSRTLPLIKQTLSTL